MNRARSGFRGYFPITVQGVWALTRIEQEGWRTVTR
jgi:hypothetical protein